VKLRLLAALLVAVAVPSLYSHRHTYCASCQRDSHGHIKRSAAARRAFKRQHPCPSTGRSTGACPGYVIDHVVPLKRGGPDTPNNMQWEATAEAKAKDRL
jgi:hypothetical protein